MRFYQVPVKQLIFLFFLTGCVFPAAGPTATSSPEPPVINPDESVLHWTRSGGIAGFCDDLMITGDGRAVASACSSTVLPEPQPLLQSDWDRLQAWLTSYASYTDVMTDDGVADAMTRTLDFYGVGTEDSTEMEMQSIMQFAERIFTEMYTPPTAVPTATSEPTASGPCMVTAGTDVTVYSRPSPLAGVFGTLAAGDSIAPAVRSAEDWYGFDPGVAQAANVGVFRNRWIPPDADITVAGDCASLPVAPEISPTACYLMAMFDIPVYTDPDTASSVIVTLPVEGWAAVTATSAAGWLQLDLNDSSQPQPDTGWVEPAAANFNGPSCGSLPALP